MPLQVRRGTNAERLAMTQPLAAGELLYVVSPEERLYIGNGTTLGGVQITGYTDGDAKDAASTILTGGSHNGINFAYNTATNVITATVDLSDYTGTIKASSFKGTIVADDSTPLIDAIDGRIFLDGTVKGNISPDTNSAYDIGSASFRFRDLYLSGSSIRLGAATITAVGAAVNLPAGSTINGEPLNSSNLLTEISANIIADDSTVMVNTTTKTVTAGGGFIGNITGNVFTNLIDSADSSQIVITPVVRFESDIIAENDLSVQNLVLNGISHQTIGQELFPTPQTGEILPHYLTFVDAINGRTVVKTDGDLRYTPDTEELSVGKLIVTANTNCPTISSTNIITSNVQSNGTLLLYSNLTTTANARVVSIGDGSVDGRFQLSTSSDFSGQALATINQSHSTVDANNFQFNRSRGTIASPIVIQNGDDIADVAFAGYDGGTYRVKASISATVDGAVSTNVVPTKLTFATSATSSAPIAAMEINSSQRTTFFGAITLAVYADNAARDAAITAPTAGMMVFNTTGTKFQGYTGAAWVDLN